MGLTQNESPSRQVARYQEEALPLDTSASVGVFNPFCFTRTKWKPASIWLLASKNKITLILALVFTISFSFGMVTMDMDENGNMSDCPFADTAAICPMGFFEHISTFQNHFKAIPSRSLLLTILVLVFLLVLHHKTIPKKSLIKIGLKFFFKDKPELLIFNKLLLALSDGIIQPKLYA